MIVQQIFVGPWKETVMTAKKRKRMRSLKRSKKKDEISSIFEEEEEDEEDEPDYDPWRTLRQKVRHDLKDLYWSEVQQFLDRGKSQTYAENAAFNAPLPVSRERLRRAYLERLK